MKARIGCVVVGFLSLVLSLAAQNSGSSSAAAQVPPLIQFSSVATELNGRPLTGPVGITFYLYKDQQGGPPLWMETQNVQPDQTGHYTVLLGSTTSQGLPASIFVSGEAHWLGLQVQGQEEQPRVLLVSAPYALKAGDAETIGGLPPSAFMLAAPASPNRPNNGSGAGTAPAGTTAGVVGSGTAEFVPLWTANSILGNSVLFQSGSGSTATVGINTITPAATLDVNGNMITRGALQLPSLGIATAGGGFNSQPFSLQGSSFNSGNGKAIGPLFQWQTEPSGNNSSSPAGTLNLLYGSGSGSPTETGLSVASNGQITFATGQTFPGGGGTVTSVGTGLGLKGGPITTSGTLTIDPAVVPQLGAANTFTGNQGVNGTITATSSGDTISGTTTGSNADGAVTGNATATSGTTFGVFGQASSPSGFGLYATNTATSGNAVGMYGTTQSPTGFGVEGTNAVGGTGVFGEGTPGVSGTSASPTTGYGVVGFQGSPPPPPGNPAGVYGWSSSSNGYGVEGQGSNIGVYGTGSVGVSGVTSAAAGAGVTGYANASTGFANGVFGANFSASGGIAGVTGVAYASTGTTAGVLGNSNSSAGYGVEGIASVGGSAGYFLVANSSANILQGSNNGTSKFTVDSAGDVIAAGAVSGSSFQIGGQPFAYGNYLNSSVFLGFAGSPTTDNSVGFDTAVGLAALQQDANGENTAVGWGALGTNTTGSANTGVGLEAGSTIDGSKLTGSGNTVLGAFALLSTGTLTNATAIGSNTTVSESNALILGNSANVGIGTSAPGHLLDVAGATAIDSTGLNNGTGIDLTFGLNAGEGISSSRTAAPNQYGIDLWTDFARRISIEQHGNVGIGTTSPDNLLTVNGSADKPGGGSWGTFSDARLKTVNGGFTDGLSQVMKIHPIHYRYKPDNAMGIRDTDEHIGVVAQEVQKVIPEAVTENSKGYLLVNNDPIIWTMLNAIKEQQGEVQKAQAVANDQQAELSKALRLIKQQQNLLRAQSAAMRTLKAEVRETRESFQKVKAQVSASQPALVAAK
jgi:endosialidase-like protein